jgi:hypothetical protein
MKKADNFDASKWLIENKITTQSRLNENKIPGVDVDNDGEQITLSGDSGDYDGFIEGNGTVSFSVTNDEEDFNDQNWKDILGDDHVFVKIANAINTDVEALGDYVMITVKADDLTSMNESKLNEDLTDSIAALPDFNSAMDREKSELIVGKYAVVRYDESGEGGENMYVVWDNTVNQDEIGSYDDVPEFESEDPAEVATFLKKNESLNEANKNEMNMMAKAIMDYYNEIDGIQNTDVKELREDLKLIIKDNKDNAELVAAFENVLNQPAPQYNRITSKLWYLASDMYDTYISNFNPHLNEVERERFLTDEQKADIIEFMNYGIGALQQLKQDRMAFGKKMFEKYGTDSYKSIFSSMFSGLTSMIADTKRNISGIKDGSHDYK